MVTDEEIAELAAAMRDDDDNAEGEGSSSKDASTLTTDERTALEIKETKKLIITTRVGKSSPVWKYMYECELVNDTNETLDYLHHADRKAYHCFSGQQRSYIYCCMLCFDDPSKTLGDSLWPLHGHQATNGMKHLRKFHRYPLYRPRLPMALDEETQTREPPWSLPIKSEVPHPLPELL